MSLFLIQRKGFLEFSTKEVVLVKRLYKNKKPVKRGVCNTRVVVTVNVNDLIHSVKYRHTETVRERRFHEGWWEEKKKKIDWEVGGGSESNLLS